MTPMRAKDVIAELGVSKSRAYEIMRECSHVRFGRSVRVSRESLARWLAENTTPAQAPELPSRVAPSKPGVYAIRGSGPFVKIGRADNIRRRLRQLQGAHPEPLTLVAVLSQNPDDEKLLHDRFALLRQRGEWFRLGAQLVEAIRGASA